MIPEAVRWYKAAGAQQYHDALCIFDCHKYEMPKDLGGVKFHMGWDYCAAQLERLGYIGDAFKIYQLHLGQEGERVLGALLLSSLTETPCFSSDKPDVAYGYNAHIHAYSDHNSSARHHKENGEQGPWRWRQRWSAVSRYYCRHELKSLQQLGHMSLVFNAAAACSVFGPRSMRIHHLQPPLELGFALSQRSLQLASLQLWFCHNKQRVQLLCCSGALSNLTFRLVRFEGQEIRFFKKLIVKRCFSVHAWRHHLSYGGVYYGRYGDGDGDDDGGGDEIRYFIHVREVARDNHYGDWTMYCPSEMPSP
jgi:hypothetical protein